MFFNNCRQFVNSAINKNHTQLMEKKPFTKKIRQKLMVDLKLILSLSLVFRKNRNWLSFPAGFAKCNGFFKCRHGSLIRQYVQKKTCQSPGRIPALDKALASPLIWTATWAGRRRWWSGRGRSGGARSSAGRSLDKRKEIYWPKKNRRKFPSQFSPYIVHESI